ncbi:MAG: Spy/CpxP family protein refolding chaperone, partial [Terriglobia bacterium]
MKATIVSFALVIVLCGQAMAQEPAPPAPGPSQGLPPPMMNPPAGGPPGMHPGRDQGWWKDPEVVQKLHISDDQVRKLDKIAQDHQIQEIDLRADLEKQDAVLRLQMETDPPDEAQVLAQIDKVTQARAKLEKSHVEMLLATRRVLTAEQAQKLRDLRPKFAPPRPGFG